MLTHQGIVGWIMENRICPYCSGKMRSGAIDCAETLYWHPDTEKPYRVSRWSVSENAVILDTCGLVRMAHTEAMYCESCGKIIIDVPMQ